MNFVGDICINHAGSLEKAFELIEKFSFLDVIKAQKLTPKLYLTEKKYNSPHPVPKNAFGKTYGEHKNHLEFTVDEHIKIKNKCHLEGVRYALSVFDMQAAKDAIDIQPEYIKIPSAKCNDVRLIKFCLEHFKWVHVSLGMTNKSERDKVKNISRNIIFYGCTSNYDNQGPIYIEGLQGFSCHAPDIGYGQVAIIKGSQWIEYHITDDRNAKGTDHRVSLLPREYKRLVTWYKKNIPKIKRISFKRPDHVPEHEVYVRKKLWRT